MNGFSGFLVCFPASLSLFAFRIHSDYSHKANHPQAEPGSWHPYAPNSVAALEGLPSNVHAVSLPLIVCPALGFYRLPSLGSLAVWLWVRPLAGTGGPLEGDSRGRWGAWIFTPLFPLPVDPWQ